MRQGNGTDILGLNDPRNASIGVIYVSPTDERKSVLAAILTQERLGRKQVAVVLPDQNKAFQRPGDFDDLKSMRNKLQTQVVFIAPGGPGPAAFARQRNFPVYTTLEGYARALKDEEHVQGSSKKGWPFSGSRQKSVSSANGTTHTSGTTKSGAVQPRPLAAKSSSSRKQVQEPNSKSNDHSLPFVAGAGLAAAGMAGNGNSDIPRNNGTSVAQPAQSSTEEHLHDLPSSAASDATPNNAVPARLNGNNEHLAENEGGSDGPMTIDLPAKRNKPTLKLPVAGGAPLIAPLVPAAAPEPQPAVLPVNKAPKPRNSGKIAAVGAASGAAAAGGMVAASLARIASGGSAPPTRGNTGGGGPGNPRRRTGVLILALLALLALTIAVCGSIAYSAPNLLGPLKNVVPRIAGQSTVTIVPDSKTVNNSYLINAVPGNPDATKREVSARVVTGSSASQSKTVNATGVKKTQAAAARGTLTFINGSFAAYTVGSGTPIQIGNGISIVTDAPVTIPAAVPGGNQGRRSVGAHASAGGANGNIAAHTISGTCCSSSNSIFVENSTAFSGGQDPQNYTFVQQSDIDSAISTLQPPLVVQAQNALKSQIHSNEQVTGSTTCTPALGQDHNAGDKASSVTVTVSVTCKAEVYDQSAALLLAANLLKTKATNDLGSDYGLVGDVVTQSTTQGVNKGVVSLLVSAKGVWVYQFTPSRQQDLKKLIAGRSTADATTILKSQRGVSDVTFDPKGTTLPTNLDGITIVIQGVSGLHGGGGTSPGGGTNITPTVTGPGTKQTPQPGLGVGGS